MYKFEKGLQILREVFDFQPINKQIDAKQGNKNAVIFKDSSIEIEYKDTLSFFRLYMHALKNGGENYQESELFPRLTYMLDCSRNAVINLQSIKRLASILAVSGYTALSLYCEDVYEVKEEPCFGYMRGRYTVKELAEIKGICEDFGLEIIMSVQGLAHMRSIYRWEPYYKECIDCNDVLLVDSERTYQLIDNMFAALAVNFSGCRVNIGFDEPFMLGRGKFLSKHGYEPAESLYYRHLEKVLQIAGKYQLKTMMWADFLFNEFKDKQKILDLTKRFGVELIYWGYGDINCLPRTKEDIYKEFYDSIKNTLDKFGNVVFACADWKFLGLAPHNRVSLKIAEGSTAACIDLGIQEVWQTSWGDTGAETSPFATLPAIVYYGYQRIFGKAKDCSFEEYFQTYFGSVQDFCALELANYVDDISTNTTSKSYLYNDVFFGVVDNTIKEDYSIVYKKNLKILSEIKPEKGYEYLYETQIRLLELLLVKYDLGIRIRQAYKQQDKQALQTVCKQIPQVIEKIRAFYKAFKFQFLKDNKPFGLEVHTARIGALILRLEDCQERLEEYLCGKVDKIPELEEELLDILGAGKNLIYLNWGELVSSGTIIEYMSFA